MCGNIYLCSLVFFVNEIQEPWRADSVRIRSSWIITHSNKYSQDLFKAISPQTQNTHTLFQPSLFALFRLYAQISHFAIYRARLFGLAQKVNIVCWMRDALAWAEASEPDNCSSPSNIYRFERQNGILLDVHARPTQYCHFPCEQNVNTYIHPSQSQSTHMPIGYYSTE